jgi:hypothetical protein
MSAHAVNEKVAYDPAEKLMNKLIEKKQLIRYVARKRPS